MSDIILSETRGNVGLITFNRPDALNAINLAVMDALIARVAHFDRDENIGCIVLAGNEKAFVAGADIKEMADKTYMEMFLEDKQSEWQNFAGTRTPMIAAVSGYALGGGCEIAMMCDMIFAADNAMFGQPEIKLGVIPGWGGTQRLVRAVGKAKAMDMVLTGRMMDAEEAERSGLVARIVPAAQLLEETLAVARRIADYSTPSTLLGKEAVNRAFETSLAEGVNFERKLFYSLFATKDQKEGMEAFVAKRKPQFENR